MCCVCSGVRGVPCDGEGELLCAGGAGAWQDLQSVGDGRQLHRLLPAQRETHLQNRSVHTLKLKVTTTLVFFLLALWGRYITYMTFLLYFYICGGPERLSKVKGHLKLSMTFCSLCGSSISASDRHGALHCHVGLSHAAMELNKSDSRAELHPGVLSPVWAGGRGAQVGVQIGSCI